MKSLRGHRVNLSALRTPLTQHAARRPKKSLLSPARASGCSGKRYSTTSAHLAAHGIRFLAQPHTREPQKSPFQPSGRPAASKDRFPTHPRTRAGQKTVFQRTCAWFSPERPVRSAFTTARNPKNLALAKTDREREEASALLPEALERCKDLYDTVEYFYRKDTDDGSRRTKCARWGVQYASDPSEPATPPANPNLPTPPAPNP